MEWYELAAWLAAWLAVFVGIAFMTWDRNKPADNRRYDLRDDDIRANNEALEAAFNQEHYFETGGSQSGAHRTGALEYPVVKTITRHFRLLSEGGGDYQMDNTVANADQQVFVIDPALPAGAAVLHARLRTDQRFERADLSIEDSLNVWLEIQASGSWHGNSHGTLGAQVNTASFPHDGFGSESPARTVTVKVKPVAQPWNALVTGRLSLSVVYLDMKGLREWGQ